MSRFLPVHRLACAVILVVAALGLAACGTSNPPPATTPKPASAATSAPKTAASPGAAANPKPSPSPAAAPGIQIVDGTLAAATPWFMLRLTGGEPQIVSGWRLEVADTSLTIPGHAIIQPDETLMLHAGTGESSDREVFLGPESMALALAAAPGARARLIDATGAVEAETTVPRF